MTASPRPQGPQGRVQVAVIGGGIVGLMTALGLLKRNISVKIYEQSRGFRELGAGVAFTANAMECMALLDPHIVDAVNAVATPNGEDMDKPNDYLRWHDGYHWDAAQPEATDDKLLFTLHSGYKGFQGCHRAHLLDELVKYVPPDVVEFRKRLTSYEDRGGQEKILLRFEDGSTAEADAVIACDGIKSTVRRLLLGEDNPASYPHFSHKVAYRALVPMDQAELALGSFKARNQHMHTGPGAHLLHFPVSGGKLLNVVAFATEPQDWPLGSANSVGNMTAPATSEQVAEVFREWGPTVRNIVALLPAQLDRWAIFDTYDHPAPTFVDGRVCLAGDAAHASSPHHGAGAGIGVEDALSICTLLERVNETLGRGGKTPGASGGAAGLIEKAFRVYDAVRAPRSQWLVKSSREVCDIYEWNYPATGTDWEKCLGEITARSHKLWYFDITGMLAELEEGYETQVYGSNEAADGTLDPAGGPICV